jgi:translation initiation factor IF-3
MLLCFFVSHSFFYFQKAYSTRRCISISTKSFINDEIKASEVRLIDAEGNQIGIVSIAQARRLAEESGLDLVEIAPEAKPPVCKVMDFGKYRFEKEKREKEMKKKQQTVELKELQLRCRIDTHDFNTKLNKALEFLTKGNRVKVLVKFFGREMAHTENGLTLLQKFADACEEVGVVEKPAKLDGRNMIMILAPKRQANQSKGR